jgi:sugar phosphate isomerase/epimerase
MKALGATIRKEPQMSAVPIALQLYSVRGECKKDLPATLASVARLGYAGAEPWGYGGEEVAWQGVSAADLRRMFHDNGLKCCGFHLGTQALVGDGLCRTIELNETLGSRFLIVAGDKKRMGAADTIKELAGILDAAAAKLEPHGMSCGYHAHGFDFQDVEGTTAWERLFDQVGPDVVMQMDVGNCANGGGDPIAMLKKYPDRARTVHLKDYGKPGGVIGEGEADWPEVFKLCESIHRTEWYVVEEGGTDGIGFDVCERSLKSLRAMGK